MKADLVAANVGDLAERGAEPEDEQRHRVCAHGHSGIATFEPGTDRLSPGDLIVTVSDGVSEAFSSAGEELGEDRLLGIIGDTRGASAADLVDRILAGVRAFTHGAVQSDDITVMVIRYFGEK